MDGLRSRLRRLYRRVRDEPTSEARQMAYLLGLGVLIVAAAILRNAPDPTVGESTAPDAAEATRAPWEGVGAPSAVLVDSGHYVDSLGNLIIVGVVENTGNVMLDKPQITAAFYDDAGNLLGSETGRAMPRVVVEGARAPFRMYIKAPPADWARYDFMIQADPASRYQYENHYDYPHFQTEVEVELRGEDRLFAFGTVTNAGTLPMKLVNVVVVLYDAEGRLLGIIDEYIDLNHLPPGETSTFTHDIPLYFLVSDAEVASWETVVYGYVDDDDG